MFVVNLKTCTSVSSEKFIVAIYTCIYVITVKIH